MYCLFKNPVPVEVQQEGQLNVGWPYREEFWLVESLISIKPYYVQYVQTHWYIIVVG